MIVLFRSLVLSLGAAALVALCWIGSSAAVFPLSRINLDRGQQLFERRCISCHAVQPSDGSSMGPNLAQIAITATRRVPGMSAEEFILESMLNPAAYRSTGHEGVMPADVCAGFTPEEVLSVVGFLMTLDVSLDARRLADLSDSIKIAPPQASHQIDFAEVEAGRKIYLTKGACQTCHPLHAIPGFELRGPSLLSAGHHDPTRLRAAIRNPSAHIVPAYKPLMIWLTSGKQIQGRLLRRNQDHVEVLVNDSGSLRLKTIQMSEVEYDDDGLPMIATSKVSSMPKYGSEALSDREVDQLVAFLRSLH